MLRVEAGTPAQGAEVVDTTFIPEVGRTERAISYQKGCYLGQEPVVMARDRGQINRLLRGVLLPGGPVLPGAPLFRDGKEVGRVTSSVVSPANFFAKPGTPCTGCTCSIRTVCPSPWACTSTVTSSTPDRRAAYSRNAGSVSMA